MTAGASHPVQVRSAGDLQRSPPAEFRNRTITEPVEYQDDATAPLK
jgi:hypothetical protein